MRDFNAILAKVRQAREQDATVRMPREDVCFPFHSTGGAINNPRYDGAHTGIQGQMETSYSGQHHLLMRRSSPDGMEESKDAGFHLPPMTHDHYVIQTQSTSSNQSTSGVSALPAEVTPRCEESRLFSAWPNELPPFHDVQTFQQPPSRDYQYHPRPRRQHPRGFAPSESSPGSADMSSDIPPSKRVDDEERRARNRGAAAKCRAKKQEHVRRLERRIGDLRTLNSDLERHVVELRSEIERLQLICNHHNCVAGGYCI